MLAARVPAAPTKTPPRYGMSSVGVLVLLILGMLYFFMWYPVIMFYRDQQFLHSVIGNARMNR